MTGYQSKKAAALDEDGMYLVHHTKARLFDKLGNKVPDDDDDTQVYSDALTIAYQSGYYDGKKAALAGREWNFCPRCGKRTQDIHTCTPPQRKPLTDEEIKAIEDGIWKPEFFDDTERQANCEFARAIEAAHGIKEQS